MSRGLSGAIGFTSVVLLLGVATTADAQEVEISGNVSITSDYAFRGISQTLEEPAVQGGIDVGGPSGLYAGVWGSSVNFGEDVPRAQMELDLYAGIAPSISGFDLDLGALYYAYPGALSTNNYDFFEVYGGVGRTVGLFNAGLSGAYSPDYFGASGTGLFGAAELSLGIPNTPLSVSGSFGRQLIEDNDAWGTPDYNAWSAGASAELIGLELGVSVVGTNLSEAECFGGTDLCKTRFIVSLTRGL